MRDYFMGAEVELEELGLGAPAPEITPPQGVILAELDGDGWTRKYLYKASRDLSGKRTDSKILVSEVPPGPSMEGEYGDVPAQEERAVPVSRPVRVNIPSMGGLFGAPIPLQSGSMGAPRAVAASAMDSRLQVSANSSVPLLKQGPLLGQAPPPPPPPPVAPELSPEVDVPVPLSTEPVLPAQQQPPRAPVVPPASPLLPANCTREIQLPDGTVIHPDDELTLKNFCALVPYLKDLIQKDASTKGPGRPGGPIPLSTGFPGLPSFGPAGGSFGGGGGGGGNSQAGPGPIGVVTGPVPVGGQGQGAQGLPGPAGAAGVGSIIDGVQKTDGNFLNAGAMVIVPGTTFAIVVGGNGNVRLGFSFILSPTLGFTSIDDVFAGIQIDATQYQLWRSAEQQGAGGDLRSVISASGELFINLTPGPHTVSLIYGNNPALNTWALVASPSEPASIVAQHS